MTTRNTRVRAWTRVKTTDGVRTFAVERLLSPEQVDRTFLDIIQLAKSSVFFELAKMIGDQIARITVTSEEISIRLEARELEDNEPPKRVDRARTRALAADKRHALSSKERYEVRRKNGLCVMCGANAVVGYDGKPQSKCAHCFEVQRARQARWRARQ